MARRGAPQPGRPPDPERRVTSPLARIPDLAAWLAAAGLDELGLVGPEGQVRLVRGHHGAATVESVAADAGPEVVTSPGIGHFLSVHPLRVEPIAAPGEPIRAGQPIGLLRVGAMLLPVTASRDGIVARVVAPEGTLVGYGDPLVEFWPEE